MTRFGPALAAPAVFALVCLAASADGDFYEGPDVSAAAILRARGFLADELQLTTRSGYKLRMTRGRNPLFPGGRRPGTQPILFVHGVLATANNFLVNSFGAQPRDLSRASLANESLSREPSVRSLALLALNRGCETWFVDRRGAPGSRERVQTADGAGANDTRREDARSGPLRAARNASGPMSMDEFGEQLARALDSSGLLNATSGGATRDLAAGARGFAGPLASFIKTVASLGGVLAHRVPRDLDASFWDFSLDEQADEDFVEMVEMVSEQTGGGRVALVTHSAGGAIALMAQSLHPKRLADKLSSSVYWSPAFSVGNGTPLASLALAVAGPLVTRLSGPLLPTSLTPVLQASFSLLCANPLARATICRALLETLYGSGGGREPALPQLISSLFYTSSAHEIAQFAQQAEYTPHAMHRFSARSPGADGAAYELARVLTKRESMSFYVGSSDMLVAPASVRLTVAQLGGPVKFREIDEIDFSHVGYFFNEQAPERAIVDSMRDLEERAVRD